MKREIKFRYTLKNKHTNKIHYKWYTLNQIQIKGLTGLFDVDNYDIISVEQFTGLKDKNGKGKDVYERDLFEVVFGNVPEGFKPMNFKENHIVIIGKVVHRWDGFYVEFMHPEAKQNVYKSLFEFLKNEQKVVIGNEFQTPELLKN